MRYEPIHDRVIVKEVEENKTTGGGLWIPDAARINKGIAFGEVIAAGQGRVNAEGKLIPLHVKIGDVVCFPRQAPAVLPLMSGEGQEEDVLLLHERDIIAKVHGLPRATALVDLTGAPLSLAPQSLALPDSVYANRDGIDRCVSDLRETNAPPDVIREIQSEQVDQHEGSPEVIEAPQG